MWKVYKIAGMNENLTNHMLIFGGKSLSINYSLVPTMDRVTKSFSEEEREILPLFLKLDEIFIGIPSYKTTFQLSQVP